MTRRTVLLDESRDTDIAKLIIEAVSDTGYTVEEIIPGLILTVSLLAEQSAHPEAYLDEAANLLADGPAGDEYWEEN